VPIGENKATSAIQGCIYWKIPPWERKYQRIAFGGRNMKRGNRNRGICEGRS
jgi:hypothetical protein